jgi:hypothetical protein
MMTDTDEGFEAQDVVGGAEMGGCEAAFAKEIEVQSGEEAGIMLKTVQIEMSMRGADRSNSSGASTSDGEEADTCAGSRSCMENDHAKMSAVSVCEQTPLVGA